MDKAQAIHNFWSSFGLPAYDETDVPDKIYNPSTGEEEPPQMPYITYHVGTDSLGATVSLYASLWYKSTSWAEISRKAEEIAQAIVKMYPPSIQLDKGRLYIYKSTPFAQRMADPDETIRRIYLNCEAEFLTEF